MEEVTTNTLVSLLLVAEALHLVRRLVSLLLVVLDVCVDVLNLKQINGQWMRDALFVGKDGNEVMIDFI